MTKKIIERNVQEMLDDTVQPDFSKAEIFAIQWKNESKCDSEFCFSSLIEAEAYLARKSSEYQGIVVPLYRYQAP